MACAGELEEGLYIAGKGREHAGKAKMRPSATGKASGGRGVLQASRRRGSLRWRAERMGVRGSLAAIGQQGFGVEEQRWRV